MRRMFSWMKGTATRRTQGGFTLFELALVIAIISVMVGGAAATSGFIRSASLQSVGKELGDLQNALNRYQETYGSLPGDSPDAGELFGCAACNGNGNGKIDAEEADLFFEHLARAKLMKMELRGGNQGGGRLMPKSDARSGAVIALEVRAPDRVVAVVRMENEGGGVGPLTAEEAQNIDRRIDDGNASNGRMVVEAAANSTTLPVTTCKTGVTYNVGNAKAQCNVAFVLLGKAFTNAQDKSTEYQWVVEPKAQTTNTGTWSFPEADVSNPQGWGDCSQTCGGGIQTRSILCTPPASPVDLELTVKCVNIVSGVAGSASQCVGPTPSNTRKFRGCTQAPPPTQQACNTGVTCPNGWNVTPWGACKNRDGSNISAGSWETGPWGNCSASCGGGKENRKIFCREKKGVRTRIVTCPSEATADCDGPRPTDTEECGVANCTLPAPATQQDCNQHSCDSGWKVTPWGNCSPEPRWDATGWSTACYAAYTTDVVQCGGPAVRTRTTSCTAGGTQTRSVSCVKESCTGAAPDSSKPCDHSCQGDPPADVSLCYAGTRWGDVYNSKIQLFRHTEDGDGWVGCMTQ